MPVMEKEAGASGGRERPDDHDGDRRLVVARDRSGNNDEGGDHADAGGETVDPVDQVDGVHEENVPPDREQEAENLGRVGQPEGSAFGGEGFSAERERAAEG